MQTSGSDGSDGGGGGGESHSDGERALLVIGFIFSVVASSIDMALTLLFPGVDLSEKTAFLLGMCALDVTEVVRHYRSKQGGATRLTDLAPHHTSQPRWHRRSLSRPTSRGARSESQ